MTWNWPVYGCCRRNLGETLGRGLAGCFFGVGGSALECPIVRVTLDSFSTRRDFGVEKEGKEGHSLDKVGTSRSLVPNRIISSWAISAPGFCTRPPSRPRPLCPLHRAFKDSQQRIQLTLLLLQLFVLGYDSRTKYPISCNTNPALNFFKARLI